MNAPVSHPDWLFLRARLSHWIALGFGSGLSKTGPGTVGTLVAWGLWLVAIGRLDPLMQAAIIATGFVIGLWACQRCAQDMGVDDHGAIVWDEIIAFWLVLLVVPGDFVVQFAAFVAFRFFDIVKPPPIGWMDRTLRGGFGIMIDDIAAAALTLVVIALGRTVL